MLKNLCTYYTVCPNSDGDLILSLLEREGNCKQNQYNISQLRLQCMHILCKQLFNIKSKQNREHTTIFTGHGIVCISSALVHFSKFVFRK